MHENCRESCGVCGVSKRNSCARIGPSIQPSLPTSPRPAAPSRSSAPQVTPARRPAAPSSGRVSLVFYRKKPIFSPEDRVEEDPTRDNRREKSRKLVNLSDIEMSKSNRTIFDVYIIFCSLPFLSAFPVFLDSSMT